MKTSTVQITTTVYQSDIMPSVKTDVEKFAKVIEWADANPVAYEIVSENRSLEFGRESVLYLGYERGIGPGKILSRLETFRRELVERNQDTFQAWLAHFTFNSYKDKDFQSGFMKQYDGQYIRSCHHVDYTTKMLPEVIDRFRIWCGNTFEVRAIWLDDNPVWEGCSHNKSRKRNEHGKLECLECGRTIQG
jgi:hypothetical protein